MTRAPGMPPDSRLLTAASVSLLLHVLVLAGAATGHDTSPMAALTSMTVTLAGGNKTHTRSQPAADSTRRAAVPVADSTSIVDATAATGVADPTPFVEARSDITSLNNPAPPYPLAARRRGMEGRVVLEAEISAEGRCTAARVRESSGHALLDESALQTVLRWRFVPASRAGTPVASRVEVPIVFRLQGDTTTASR